MRDAVIDSNASTLLEDSLRTLGFYGTVATTGSVFTSALYVGSRILPNSAAAASTAREMRGWWAQNLIRSWFTDVEVRGEENLKNLSKPVIIVSNHRSNLDPMFVSSLGFPMTFLAKDAVIRTPVIGWWARLCRDVFVDRKDPDSRAKSLKAVEQRLHEGVSVALFAEGTRGDGNQTLLPFRDGAFRIALANKVAILPVALKNTERLTPKGKALLKSHPVRMTVLPAVVPRNQTVEELRELVWGRIHSALIAD